MKKQLSVLPDKILDGENYGCLINGELHVATGLYKRIYNNVDIDFDLLNGLLIIDVDELVYLERLNDLIIFTGQQVKVFDNGFYLGDGTVTCYPNELNFEFAEVTLHFPFKKEVLVCGINSLVPVLKNQR